MKHIQPHHIGRLTAAQTKPPAEHKTQQMKTAFKEVLEQSLQSQQIKVSKHAERRMYERGIHITSERWEQISHKIQEAKAKGIQDSLVITRDAALVVSAQNQTVITALDPAEADNQIFTNINGAIFMKN